MEEIKIQVTVEVSFKDDNYLFDILAPEHLSIEEIRSVLVGGVCLTIHSEETPKEQARVLKDVITYMEQDFVDIDSFRNVEVKPPKKDGK
jgi:hypothetical protein